MFFGLRLAFGVLVFFAVPHREKYPSLDQNCHDLFFISVLEEEAFYPNSWAVPFEKSSLHFLVTVDCASHIHLLKHRIGVSINGESARYKELKDDKYYVPSDWSLDEQAKYIAFMEDAIMRYHKTLQRLVDSGMDRKRAKESARFYLPYGNQITMDVMFNWRSFNHFLGLRMKPEAQKEICWIADEMLRQVREIPGEPFKGTISAFGY